MEEESIVDLCQLHFCLITIESFLDELLESKLHRYLLQIFSFPFMHIIIDIGATFQEWIPKTLRHVFGTANIIPFARHLLSWLHHEKRVCVLSIQYLLLGLLLDSGFESFEVGQLFNLEGLEFVRFL